MPLEPSQMRQTLSWLIKLVQVKTLVALIKFEKELVLLRAGIFLVRKLEKIKWIRKLKTSGIDISNLIEKSDLFQGTLNESMKMWHW